MKAIAGLCAGALLALSAFLIGSASGAPRAVHTAALPRVIIDAPVKIPDEPKVAARMRLGSDYDGPIGIEVRGASSQLFPKKSYTFETRKASGKDKAVSLLGLPEESDWILYASYNDKTLLRNVLAYWTARRLGRYAPRTRYVELVLNGRYQGVYVLVEKPKVDKNRVHVRDDDVTGGYLLEARRDQSLRPGEKFFRTPVTKRPILYHDPELKELSPKRAKFIRDYVGAFERALYGVEFKDPEIGYREYLDLPAAVDYVLLNELFKNTDGFRLSTFLHKDVGRKLAFGPVWDFDIAMGNSYAPGHVPEGWLLGNRPWVSRLYRDPAFVDLVTDRWKTLRRQGLLQELLRELEVNEAYLREAQRRNFARWPILGKYVWPNPRDPKTGGFPKTYDAELEALESWLERRVAWMDANLESLG